MKNLIAITERVYESQCEWHTFINGINCKRLIEFAILDTLDKSEPTTPEGFHWAHLCAMHLGPAMSLMEAN